MTDLSKGDDLRRRHCYHPGADRVTDPLFQSDDFFDPRDLLLVKYELLRRVRCDGVWKSSSKREPVPRVKGNRLG